MLRNRCWILASKKVNRAMFKIKGEIKVIGEAVQELNVWFPPLRKDVKFLEQGGCWKVKLGWAWVLLIDFHYHCLPLFFKDLNWRLNFLKQRLWIQIFFMDIDFTRSSDEEEFDSIIAGIFRCVCTVHIDWLILQNKNKTWAQKVRKKFI